MFSENLRVKNSLICSFFADLLCQYQYQYWLFFAKARFICRGPFVVLAVVLLVLLPLLLYLLKRFRRLYALIKFKLYIIALFDIHNWHMLNMAFFTIIWEPAVVHSIEIKTQFNGSIVLQKRNHLLADFEPFLICKIEQMKKPRRFFDPVYKLFLPGDAFLRSTLKHIITKGKKGEFLFDARRILVFWEIMPFF